MIPKYPKFKFVEYKDLNAIDGYLKKYPCPICELNLPNIFIWKNFDRPQITLINGNLCIYVSPANESSYFLEPIGTNKLAETVEICIKHARKLSRTSEHFVKSIDHAKYNITEVRNQFDYVYLTKKLAELKGRHFDGKRNAITQFKKLFPKYKFIELKKAYKSEADELFEKWFALRQNSRHLPKLAYDSQKSAIDTAFEYYDKFNFIGGAICIDGKMKAFTLGSRLNKDTISVHFAYGDPSAKGISPALLREACNNTYARAKYVNLEQDLGIPGLRKSKLSNHPVRLEKKYEIRPKST